MAIDIRNVAKKRDQRYSYGLTLLRNCIEEDRELPREEDIFKKTVLRVEDITISFGGFKGGRTAGHHWAEWRWQNNPFERYKRFLPGSKRAGLFSRPKDNPSFFPQDSINGYMPNLSKYSALHRIIRH